ncbi:MAG: sulfotransferase [Acidimicrobiales bacterium]|nr:sulfotransferase [Acidimicrobiales bacterium]
MTSEPQFFVGVGVAKAGTSWFGRYFADHPEVWFSPVKELHVFDQLLVPDCSVFTRRFDRRIERLASREVPHTDRTAGLLDGSLARRRMVEAPSLDETVDLYRQFFLERAGSVKARGEITPSYSLLPTAGYQAIRQAFPEAVFLLVLRDPVERFWSHLRFKQSREEGFDAIDQFESMLEGSGAAARNDYADLFGRLFPAVPPDQLLTLFYEDVFVDGSVAEVERVTARLGIEAVAPELSQVVKQSPPADLPHQLGQIASARFAGAYEATAAAFGRLPERWLRNRERAR